MHNNIGILGAGAGLLELSASMPKRRLESSHMMR